MDVSQSTTQKLISGSSGARRLKMGYMVGRGRGRRPRLTLGHCVEDASPATCPGSNTPVFREATHDEIISEAQTLISRRFRIGTKPLSSPEAIELFLRLHLAPLDYEVFGVILLDSHHRLIAAENLFRGTLDSCTVHVREVLRSVLQHQAAAVVLYHNHTSGVADPSKADIAITRRIKDALTLIEAKLLDHFIVGETVLSFSRTGAL